MTNDSFQMVWLTNFLQIKLTFLSVRRKLFEYSVYF